MSKSEALPSKLTEPRERETAEACYVYGVIRADRRPSISGVRGVGDTSVEFVEENRLAAAISDVSRDHLAPPDEGADDDVAWLEEAVRAHERVLDLCLGEGPVLPMRFATTFRTRDDARRLLCERQAQLESELERLSDKREWGVKVLVDRGALVSWLGNRAGFRDRAHELESQPAGRAYFGRKRLEQMLEAQAESAVAERCAEVHDRLAAVAVETRLPASPLTSHRKADIRLNGAYLVREETEVAFLGVVEHLRREHAPLGFSYEVTGPWPPYNFVAAEVVDS